MRKWKKCLLLAAGMAVALSTAAMASQAKAGDSDTVTVEVKNCKGGVLSAYYEVDDGDGDFHRVYLPLAEKVSVPKGTELIIQAQDLGYYNEKLDDVVTSHPKTLVVKEKGEEEQLCTMPDDEQRWTVKKDCVFDADCVAYVDVWCVGDDLEEIPEADKNFSLHARQVFYEGPSVVEAEITAKRGGKTVALATVPDFAIGVSKRGAGYKDDPDWYKDNFEITETGIRSKKSLPVGYYRVPYTYRIKESGNAFRVSHVNIYVGKRVTLQTTLAEYMDEGVVSEIVAIDSKIKNPLVDENATNNDKKFFDATTTTVADAMKLVEAPNDQMAGYEYTGEYVDSNGKTISRDDSSLLKDVTYKRSSSYFITPVVKKGNTTYKPAKVEFLPENEIILKYTDSWIERDGKLYYYGDSNEGYNNMKTNCWVTRGGKDVFVDKTGALVTDGIAGKNKDEEPGLWLVNSKGYKCIGYSNENYIVGMNAYTIVDGRVTDIRTAPVETPSNAEAVQKFTDGLEIAVNNSNLAEENKEKYASMLTTGINGLDDQRKNDLHDTVIEKADEALKSIYGEDKATVLCDSSSVNTAELAEEKISAKGLIAAAGSNDENVKLKITQTASDAIMKFDAKLYVGDSEDSTQLKSPVILDIEIPEDVQKLYSKYGYTYKLVHVGDGKTESVGDGETKNGLSLELSQDMTSMRIRTSSFSTFELQAVRKTSDDGTVTPGEPEKPAKPSEPENPTKPEDPSKPTTPETPNKPNKGNGNSSDRDGSDSSSSGSSYRRTKSSPSGQWVQDAKGWWYRRADGSWPKSQWIELGWNGVNSWYYFNESGYMVTGWREDGGYTYYLNPVSDGTRGQMLTGWHQIDSIWYYFNKLTGGPQGSLVKNATTPDGYKVGADGAWLQ